MDKPDFHSVARTGRGGVAKKNRASKQSALDDGISALEAQTQQLLRSTQGKHGTSNTKSAKKSTRRGKSSDPRSSSGQPTSNIHTQPQLEASSKEYTKSSPKRERNVDQKHPVGDFSQFVASQTATVFDDTSEDFWKVDIAVDPGYVDPRLRKSKQSPVYQPKTNKKRSPKPRKYSPGERSPKSPSTQKAKNIRTVTEVQADDPPQRDLFNDIGLSSPKPPSHTGSTQDIAYNELEDLDDDTIPHATGDRKHFFKDAAEREAGIRRLSFTDEVSRVSEGLDDFVPDLNVTHKQVVQQEAKVDSKRKREEQRLVEQQLFKAQLMEREHLREQSEAAVKVQSVVRARNSRKFVNQVRNQGGYSNYLAHQSSKRASKTKDRFGGWQEVFDPTTGDLWYFNKATGESQWEMPVEMGEQARDNRLGMASPTLGLLNPTDSQLPSLVESKADQDSIGRRGSDPGTHFVSEDSDGNRRNSADAFASYEEEKSNLPPLTPNQQQRNRNEQEEKSNNESQRKLLMAQQERELLETELPYVADYTNEPIVKSNHQTRTVSFAESTGVAPAPSNKLPARYVPDEEDVTQGTFTEKTFASKKSGKKSKAMTDDGANLRDTVRSALMQSKYDSVSTLLAKQVQVVDEPISNEFSEDNNEYNVEDFVKGGRSKRTSPRRKRGRSKLRNNKTNATSSKFQAPTVFDVGYPGMPTDVAHANMDEFGVVDTSESAADYHKVQSSIHESKESVNDGERASDLIQEVTTNTLNTVGVENKGNNQAKSPRKKKKNGIFSDEQLQDESKVSQLAQSAEMNQVFAPSRNKDGTNTCFLCWSMGDDRVKSCEDHGRQQPDQGDGANDGGNNSILLCMNWSLETLRKKYRSEEIQEIFAKSNSSLKWDLNRKKFVTVVQASHPTYRDLFDWIGSINKNVRTKIRLRKWFKSISDKIHAGKVPGEKAQKRCGILRVRSTLANNRWIRNFDDTVFLLRPKAPVTPDDIMLGKIGNRSCFNVDSGYLIMHRAESGPSLIPRLIVAPRTEPLMLHFPSEYSYNKDNDVFGRVPAPSYHFSQEAPMIRDDEDDTDGEKKLNRWGVAYNIHMDIDSPCSWLERMASHVARTAVSKTVKEVRDQVPELTKLRTKNTAPTTVKYARFSRRMPLAMFEVGDEDSNLQGANRWVKTITAKGGIPAMTVLSQVVTTQVPAQYGKIVVTSRQSLKAPKQSYSSFATDDGYLDPKATFKSHQPVEPFPEPPEKQVYSALDARRPPTITCSAFAYQLYNGFESLDGTDKEEAYRYYEDDDAVRNYHGANRESQTGETEYTGFRTTCLAEALPCDPDYELVDFVPSTDIAVPNDPCIHGTRTTKAGPEYPFCVPSTRDVSLLDHFHIIACAEWSANSSCCFTALGKQDPGEFSMRNETEEVLLGQLEMRIFRSFAYFQMPQIEAYFTVEGVPYWFNKKTGETFWESPLVDMEAIEDEDELPMIKDELQSAANYANDRDGTGGRKKELSQLKMRQHMLTNYDDKTTTKENPKGSEAVFAREIAKAEKKKKAQDMRLQDRVGRVSVLKADPVTLGIEGKVIDDTPPSLLLGAEPGPDMQPIVPTQKKPAAIPPAEANKEKKNVNSESSTSTNTSIPVAKTENSAAGTTETDQQDLVNSITTALAAALQQQPNAGGVSADDMLKLGLGLGLGLGMQKNQQQQQQEQQTAAEKPVESKDSSGALVSKLPESTTAVNESKELSAENRLALAKKNQELVAHPTQTPDETTPVFSDQDFETHSAAGEGVRWEVPGAGGPNDTLVRTKSALPTGFINSVYRPHTAKQHTDYLPTVPNLNEAKSVGVVKPRQILQDWEDTKFDPWSDGKSDFATSFIPNLHIDEATGQDDTLGEFVDAEGNAELRQEQERENKLREELEHVFSCARHGKYSEIEDFFDDPDCTLPIDSKDTGGNTLLSIAAQNGNKRIAKLCLRRGADVNTQNINGQSLLHYCFAYGFEDLAQYFMDKGADDSLVNADGLTCYEGLNLDDVQNL